MAAMGAASTAPLALLRTVGGNLTIIEVHRLPTLTGLDRLETVGGALELLDTEGTHDHQGLTSLEGLGSLQTVGGGMRIARNDSFQGLDGAHALTSVGALSLQDLGQVSSLAPLAGVSFNAEGDRTLNIQDNDALGSLDGLEGLGTAGYRVAVWYNDRLSDVSAIEGLGFDQSARVILNYNPQMSTCELEALVEGWEAQGADLDHEVCDNAVDACGGGEESCSTTGT